MENQLIISKEKPDKLYQRLVDRFGIEWNDGVIITNGWTVHCKGEIPAPKIIHELTHVRQQEKIGKELWWDLYISSDSFRLENEVEAYRSEYKFIKDNISDRNVRFEYLYEMARILSSPQYGKICTGSEALKMIQ